MRRRDLFFIVLLLAVAGFAWHQLFRPPATTGRLSLDRATLNSLSKWHGAIATAEASTLDSADSLPTPSPTISPAGQVKGASTDEPATTEPSSLLPIEQYNGSPVDHSLAQMLADHQLTVYPEDIVAAFPDPSLGLGSVIRIYRATPVLVTDNGKDTTYRTWTKTVQYFVTEQSIELGSNDRIDPGLDQALSLPAGGTSVHLVVTRVAVTEVKENITIPFNKVQKEDATLPRGQKTVSKGQTGQRVKTYRVTRENGVEVKRELLSDTVVSQPKDEVTTVGTKVILGETHKGTASWYNYSSTKIASDFYKRGTQLRITNLDNGKQIFVTNDGCICSDSGYVVDLNPIYFTALGGKLSAGVMPHVEVAEILN